MNLFLSDIGEDTIVVCENCDYKANMEAASSVIDYSEEKSEELYKVHTQIKDIDGLAEFFKAQQRNS